MTHTSLKTLLVTQFHTECKTITFSTCAEFSSRQFSTRSTLDSGSLKPLRRLSDRSFEAFEDHGTIEPDKTRFGGGQHLKVYRGCPLPVHKVLSEKFATCLEGRIFASRRPSLNPKGSAESALKKD